MKIAVICALEKEIELIRAQMRGVTYHTGTYSVTEGTLANHILYVTISGIGKTCAAAATQFVIDRFTPDCIINIGLAGNTDPALRKGEVVVADKAVFHDFDLHISDFFAPYYDGFVCNEALHRLACTACRNLNLHFAVGTVATGDVFVNDEKLKLDIISRTSCRCVEMEGAAIDKVASLNGLPFINIKVISDSADEDADEDFAASVDEFTDTDTSIVCEMCRIAGDMIF